VSAGVQLQAAQASNAQINREIGGAQAGIRARHRGGKVLTRPKIAVLDEDKVRTGFFEREQFEAVRAKLPEPIQAVVTFAYLAGWRVNSEVLPPSPAAVRPPHGPVGGLLHRDGTGDGVGSAGERQHQAVAGGRDLGTVVFRHGRAQGGEMLVAQRLVAVVPEAARQLGRADEIGEDDGDSLSPRHTRATASPANADRCLAHPRASAGRQRSALPRSSCTCAAYDAKKLDVS
jgi:hypothetical protein